MHLTFSVDNKMTALHVYYECIYRLDLHFRESPNVQGNAILSLSGLVLASQRYWTNLDKESQGQIDNVKDFQSQSHWATVVMDTLMSLMDVTFQPEGHILGLCQQVCVYCGIIKIHRGQFLWIA